MTPPECESLTLRWDFDRDTCSASDCDRFGPRPHADGCGVALKALAGTCVGMLLVGISVLKLGNPAVQASDGQTDDLLQLVQPDNFVQSHAPNQSYTHGHPELVLFPEGVVSAQARRFQLTPDLAALNVPPFETEKSTPEFYRPASELNVLSPCVDFPNSLANLLGNVWHPTLVAYVVSKSHKYYQRSGVLVVPGGGLKYLLWEPEGTQTAEWLNSLGFSAFILKQRVPLNRTLPEEWTTAMIDVQRAMSLVRYHATRYNIDKKRLGIIGFSAGGHVVRNLGLASYRAYPKIDAADEENFHPDFLLMLYGGGCYPPSEHDNWTYWPPAFLAKSHNDPCFKPICFRHFQNALETHSKKALTIHEYETGYHGWSFCEYYPHSNVTGTKACHWKHSAEQFLREEAFTMH